MGVIRRISFRLAVAVFALACQQAQATAGGLCVPGGGTSGTLSGGGSNLLLTLTGAAAQAPCLPAEPASRSADVPGVLAGNPVDVTDGTKVDRSVDLFDSRARPGPTLGEAVVLLFSRLYSSHGAGSEAFGPGWRHSFETRLHATRLHATRSGQGEPELQILQADGRLVRFGPPEPVRGRGIRHPALDRSDGVLDAVPPGEGLLPREQTWTWRWRDGRWLVFRADGRLVRIGDLSGARLTLRYDEADRLVSIADPGGREIRLAYRTVSAFGVPAAGLPQTRGTSRIASVDGPDGARIDYGYDAAGRLSTVHRRDAPVVNYRYTDPVSPRLGSVVFSDGRASEYRYDPVGRVISSRGFDDAHPLEFSYSGAASDGDGTTSISRHGDPLAVYRWRVIAGQRRLVETTGRGCTTCPPTGLRYGYGPSGLETVDASDRRWTARRDRAGRVTRVLLTYASASASAGSGRGIPVPESDLSVRWSDDPVLDRPLTVSRDSLFGSGRVSLDLEYDGDGRPLRRRWTGYAPVVRATRDGVARVGLRRITLLEPSSGAAGSSGGGLLALPQMTRAAADGVREFVGANGAVTRWWLDDLGRIAALDSPDSGLTTWEYDDVGRLAAETGPEGAQARYRYTASGALYERVVLGAQARGIVTRYRHSNGRLQGIEHPEQSEAYRYDDAGRIVERRVRLRLESGRHAEFATRYRYAPETGRLVARSLPDGSWLRFVRDRTGQIVTLQREVASREGAAGRDPSPAPGAVRAQVLIEEISRDRAGVRRARFGNGIEAEKRRDASGRLVAICHRGPRAGGACDILDHALRFDDAGRLLHWRQDEERSFYRHDTGGALVEAVTRGAGWPRHLRYAYDAAGHRVPAFGPAETDPYAPPARGPTVPDSPPEGVKGARGGPAGPWSDVQRDGAGRITRQGAREYRWRADGLLEAVLDRGRVVARYRYNHRGERIAKRSDAGVRHFLLDESRQPEAEIDAHGKVVRLHVRLAGDPVALIDPHASGERLTYLHLDHRGAPAAASDRNGAVIWRVVRAPFGRRLATYRWETSGPGAAQFEVPLALPGQYEDPETGLHHNDHRYYDPDAGRYLSPDPLGLRAGPNLYAYAANDPLTRIDPTGLLLFAFDGTGNSDQPPGRDDWSNVYKLSRSYADGRVWYMAGVGRDDASGIRGGSVDAVTAWSARDRVDHMLSQLERELAAPASRGRWTDIDVIGFSRGAAMGRDFANRVSDRIADGRYLRLGACVRLRFLGLWDTVAQFGLAGSNDFAWRLAIPTSVAYTAHAVALNEHRLLFPAESIFGSPLAGVRIERGFVGAHSDVGGSYAEGDLSDVALGWMHTQARLAGVRMQALTPEFERVTAPLLHDSNESGSGDREFRRRNRFGITVSSLPQRVAHVDGLQWRDTGQFIRRYASPRLDAYGDPTLVGEVEMPAYSAWLRSHYGFDVLPGP